MEAEAQLVDRIGGWKPEAGALASMWPTVAATAMRSSGASAVW
jgi:hypothetical protein